MQKSLLDFVPGVGLEPGTEVVDLFCGIGGFSQGAAEAGHRVVLAVDCNGALLGSHYLNHPSARHICTRLPDEELPLPTAGRWHLHGSPPCQKLSIMQCVPPEKQLEQAVDLVEWFLGLVERARPTTWSFEQVNHARVRALLADFKRRCPRLCDWDAFNAADFGVPQMRKRIIAGSPVLVSALRNAARPQSRPSVRDFIPHPPRQFIRTGIYQRPSYIKKTDGSPANPFGPYAAVPLSEQIRSVDETGWTVLAAGWKAWCDAEGHMLYQLTAEECALLQTFPAGYKLPYDALTRKEGVGNAIPVALARAIMRPTHSATHV